MDERNKLIKFIVFFFPSIFFTELLDNLLGDFVSASDWWNLLIMLPIVSVLLVSGFITKRIKTIFTFAIFGAICLAIFIGTQTYFNQTQIQMGIEFKEDYIDIAKRYLFEFSAMFISVFVILIIGRIARYVFDVFAVNGRLDAS